MTSAATTSSTRSSPPLIPNTGSEYLSPLRDEAWVGVQRRVWLAPARRARSGTQTRADRPAPGPGRVAAKGGARASETRPQRNADPGRPTSTRPGSERSEGWGSRQRDARAAERRPGPTDQLEGRVSSVRGRLVELDADVAL